MKQLLLIGTMLFSLSAMAQEQLQHKKRLYQDESGKLFVNKALPLYLWISDSPDKDAEKIRLLSEDSKAYTNPMYLDTDGYNTVRTPSKVDTVTKKTVYPIEDIIYEIYADGVAPKHKISIDSSKLIYTKTATIASQSALVSIVSSDDISGIETDYISINGAPFSPYTGPVKLTEEKTHTIKSYSVDRVGNASKTIERILIIDNTAPSTQLNIQGDSSGNIASGSSYYVFNAEDNGAGVQHIYYSIDGGAEKKYNYKIACKYLNEGEHTITYYSVDKVGNKENKRTFATFIDKTPPIVIDELQGNMYMINGKEFASGRTKMKLTAIDNKAGIKAIYYTFDGKTYQLYDKPFYLPNSKGNVSISYYATDNVNNKSTANQDSKKSKLAYMDLTGPKLSFNFIGLTFRNRDTVFINKDTKISLKASDSESGSKKISYRLNEGSETDYSKPFSCEKEGRYTIAYTGYDNVNNSNSGNFYFIVDTTGPDIYERYSIEPVSHNGDTKIYPSHLVLFLSATDTDAGYSKLYYSINNNPAKLYTGEITGFAKNSTYDVYVKAYDKLKNYKEKRFTFMTGD